MRKMLAQISQDAVEEDMLWELTAFMKCTQFDGLLSILSSYALQLDV